VLPQTIYLNNAAAGWPKAPGVAQAVQAALETPPSEQGRGNAASLDCIDEARRGVARLLSVGDPHRIVFTLNATHALNIALRGLDLKRGALVVTSAAEHNSVLRPLAHLRAERGIRVEIVPVGPDGTVNVPAYEAALGLRPALVALTHASNVTGGVNDAAVLLGMAKAAGAVTLLDASQSVGYLSVAPAVLAADLVAFPAHKGLHGPEGVGVLYTCESVELKPLITGGTGVRSDLELQPSELPTRLEAGTSNVPGLAGLVAALDWYVNKGLAAIQRAMTHAAMLREALAGTARVQLFGGTGDSITTPIVSFRIEGLPVEECGFILRESFGIVARTGLHCAPLVHAGIGSAPEGTVRFSPSGFNTDEEVEAAARAVAEVARCASAK
jgi:cysteine desulfurase / selenocysteine lyase